MRRRGRSQRLARSTRQGRSKPRAVQARKMLNRPDSCPSALCRVPVADPHGWWLPLQTRWPNPDSTYIGLSEDANRDHGEELTVSDAATPRLGERPKAALCSRWL